MALTPKQEAFAQAIVTGVNQSDAYRAAYKVRPKTKPESVNQNASRIMANVNVMSRVAELRLPVAKKAQITLETCSVIFGGTLMPIMYLPILSVLAW